MIIRQVASERNLGGAIGSPPQTLIHDSKLQKARKPNLASELVWHQTQLEDVRLFVVLLTLGEDVYIWVQKHEGVCLWGTAPWPAGSVNIHTCAMLLKAPKF